MRRLLGAGVGVSLALFGASASAACLKANADDQVVEGRLKFVRITIPAYRLSEDAYILRLRAPACLDGPDDLDKVENTRRIHVYATDETTRRRMRRLDGQNVRVRGSAFGGHTLHHHAPIVMHVQTIHWL